MERKVPHKPPDWQRLTHGCEFGTILWVGLVWFGSQR